MKKILLSLATALLIVPVIETSTVAQAATWHKGAPKIARGRWNDAWKYPKGGMCDLLMISKHKLNTEDQDPILTGLKYKKMGYHAYKFRGYEPESRIYESTPTMHFTKTHVSYHWFGNHYYLRKGK